MRDPMKDENNAFEARGGTAINWHNRNITYDSFGRNIKKIRISLATEDSLIKNKNMTKIIVDNDV